MNKHYYFAYGINTSPSYMGYKSHVKRIGKARLVGYHLTFAYYANIVTGGEMDGVLWEIDDDTLAQLDYREGYPTFYNRKVVNVFHETECYGAIAYIMTPDYFTKAPPSEHYLSVLEKGYTEFGIPHSQLQEALALL
jgi:gamma-glutamylcyclotransferase (GGCT)/AIG2-like uncharacterized protein YtfP